MGADLCGFILIGPEQLDECKIKEAGRVARLIFDAAKLDKAGKGIANVQAAVAEVSMFKQGVGKCSVVLFFGDDDEEKESFLERLLEEEPEDLLNDFVGMWTGKSGLRDMMSRSYEGKRIVVAGERTWGDGPEPGSAWWLCRQMDAFGILPILGIE